MNYIIWTIIIIAIGWLLVRFQDHLSTKYGTSLHSWFIIIVFPLMIITSIIILFKSTSLDPSSLDSQLQQLQYKQDVIVRDAIQSEWEKYVNNTIGYELSHGKNVIQVFGSYQLTQDQFFKQHGDHVLKEKGIPRATPPETVEAVKLKYQTDLQKAERPKKELRIYWIFLMIIGCIAMVVKTYLSLNKNWWLTPIVLILQILWAIVFCTGIVLIFGIITSAVGAREKRRQ